MSETSLIREYLQKIEMFESDPDRYTGLLHENFVQEEMPNLLNRRGQKSDAAQTIQRIAVGKQILSQQSFEIISSIEQTDRAVVEAVWLGTMAVDAGPLKKGQKLKAYFCMIFQFKDGKIFRQKNYDCFEDFSG